MLTLRSDPWASPPATPRPAPNPIVAVVGGGLLVSIGPAVRTAANDRMALAAVLVAFGVAAVVAVAGVARRSAVAGGLGAAASVAIVALAPAEARSSLVVVAAGAVAVVSALVPQSLVPGLPTRRVPVARLGLGVVLAAQFSWYRQHAVPALALLAGALVVTEWYRWRPDAAAHVEQVVGRGVTWLTRVVAQFIVLLAAIPTLYLPGLAARTRDRLLTRRRTTSTWVAREASASEDRRDQALPFAPPGRRDRRRRYRYAAVLLVTLVAATVIARYPTIMSTAASDTGTPIVYPDFAYPDEAWVDDLYAAGFDVGFHPSLGWQSTDEESTYLQVRDGVRRSWAPDDAVHTVWFVGGSALWGLGQRDDHTIPSEVARRADEAGTPIEAVNLGVPGYTQWQQQALLGNRLSRGERPDLIVVYDGANDLTSMIYRAGQGIEPLDEPPNRFHEQVERDSHFLPEPRGEPASDDELVEAFTTMYGAGVDLLTRTAAAYDVRVAFAWQPQYLSTEPSSVDAPLLEKFPVLGPPEGDWERGIIERVRAELPPEVIDLGSALDEAGHVTWFDPVHTNELGAAIVAEQLWAALEPTVEALPAGG